MAVSSIGALLGVLSSNNDQNNNNHDDNNKSSKFNSSVVDSTNDNNNNNNNNTNHTISPILIVIGIVPVWIIVSGLIHMVSLPFSDTQYFKFNPDSYVRCNNRNLGLSIYSVFHFIFFI